ncbi:hypothetical protein LCGC14_2658840 [marine sediment metagenome]|uniref:Uncharacterized protein n=1 Tax=marine sediment metagenome TaxID=412755 RepID=A0A0F8ZSG3_9ZZZZ|nr:hypothetical protein [Desulfobacterales bacterium]
MESKEFHYESDIEIHPLIKGKTIKKFGLDEDRTDDYMVFEFTDGAVLRIRYDYIYEWWMEGVD